MAKYTFSAWVRVTKAGIWIDPVYVSTNTLHFGRHSQLQKKLRLEDEEKVKVTIERV